MPRRLDKTLADYITIAISPVLIMTLVGSLVFFLQEVFYDGGYQGRVTCILGLFVMAIVLIGRISIEEGNERAILFALPLAIVVGLAISRFSDGGLLHWGLMGLCWWSAHKLTWDCTVIDEEKDASGQGLLQIVGLDGSGRTEFETPEKAPDENEDAVTSYQPVTASWEREEKKKRKPHAPGVWIVFFSLAALPLFGLGQRFIPVADVASRRHAFMLLLVYVASGLGLLLTTSFLGLRRYLRQRRVEMPAMMATVWITSGAVLIVVLLLFAALLPRPAAEYAISKVPLSFSSPQRKSSKYAVGNDGADKNSPDSKSATTRDKSQSDDEQSDQKRKSSGSSDKRQKSDDQSSRDDSQQGGDTGHDESKPDKSGKPSDEGKGDSGKSSGKGEPQKGKSQEGKSQEGKSQEAKSQEAKSQEAKSQEGKSQEAKSQEGKSQEGKSQEGKSQEGKSEEGNSRESKSQEGKSQEGKSQQGKQSDQDDPSQSGDSDRSDKSGEPSDRDPQPDSPEDSPEDQSSTQEDRPEDQGEDKSDPRQSQERQTDQDEDSENDSPPSSFSFQKLFSSLMGALGAILKWLFYIAVLLIALYWLVRSWKTVMAAWAQFLKELAELWRRLFGGKPTPEEEAAAEEQSKPAPRPFADFADPFATGMAGRYSPDELVKYTFEAVEAWARENGFPRGPEQTPHEFARQLARAAQSLGGNSRTLADLYCYVAYSPGRLRAEGTEALAQLWQQLRPGAYR